MLAKDAPWLLASSLCSWRQDVQENCDKVFVIFQPSERRTVVTSWATPGSEGTGLATAGWRDPRGTGPRPHGPIFYCVKDRFNSDSLTHTHAPVGVCVCVNMLGFFFPSTAKLASRQLATRQVSANTAKQQEAGSTSSCNFLRRRLKEEGAVFVAVATVSCPCAPKHEAPLQRPGEQRWRCLTSAWEPAVSVFLHFWQRRQGLCQSLPSDVTFSAGNTHKNTGSPPGRRTLPRWGAGVDGDVSRLHPAAGLISLRHSG